MKKGIAICAVVAALGWSSVPVVAAGTPVTVGLLGCSFNSGGQATVAAGSDVTIRFGFETRPREGIEQLLAASVATVKVDGAPIPDANGYFTPPIHSLFLVGWWGTDWRYTLPTLGSVGDQVVIDFRWDTTAPFLVVDRPDLPLVGLPPFQQPGEIVSGTCTITAV